MDDQPPPGTWPERTDAAQTGQAMIEMALVLGGMLLIMMAVVEYSYLWYISQTLSETARVGAQIVANLPGLPTGDVTQNALIRQQVYNDYYEALLVNNPDTGAASSDVEVDALFDRLPPLNRVLRPALRRERWTYLNQQYVFLRMPGALFRNGNAAVAKTTPGKFRTLAADLTNDSSAVANPQIRCNRVVQILNATTSVQADPHKVQVIIRFPYAFLTLAKYDRNWVEEFNDAKLAPELKTSNLNLIVADVLRYVGLEPAGPFRASQYGSNWEKGIWTIGAGDKELGAYLHPSFDKTDDTQDTARLSSGNDAFSIRPARKVLMGSAVFQKQIY